MNSILLIIPLLVAFFSVLFITPFWIRKAGQLGLIWPDMNKLSKEKVAGSGGIIVVVSFIVSVLAYIAYLTFYLKEVDNHLVAIFAFLLVICLLAGIGFIDDLFGWQHGGLSKRSRLILVALASIPLMVINAGRPDVSIPILGQANLGIIYALIVIPIGIMGATTTFNFLAGFNGLETGQGILLLSAAAVISYATGSSWLSIIALCMVAALIAFLFYNFYPAKVFPGNSITYAIGGLFAIISILGNFEKVAIFFFIPYIIETVLKSRGRLEKQSFGKPNKDGSLELKYSKFYALTHVSIFILKKLKIKPTEKNVVYSIWLFQLLIIILGFIIFREGIFK